MSFFKKKMSQNDWATILPFGPVTLIFYWPNNFFLGRPNASPHFRHCLPLTRHQMSVLTSCMCKYEKSVNHISFHFILRFEVMNQPCVIHI